MAEGPPVCSCGQHTLAQLKSPTLLQAWASMEGVSWSRGPRGPYFHFCQKCHLGIWSEDNRPPISNRFCRPARPSWEGRGQRSRCLLGDYFLTEPPPELYSAAAREQAKVAWKRRNQERKEAEAQRRLNAQNWEVQLWGAALPRDALQPEGTASVSGAACGAPVRGILRKRGAKRNRPVRQLTFKDGSSKYTPYEKGVHKAGLASTRSENVFPTNSVEDRRPARASTPASSHSGRARAISIGAGQCLTGTLP